VNNDLPNIPEPDTSPPIIDITVPDDYPTIQQAVDYASDGDAIFVRNGQYNEAVTVNKALFLLGEDNQTTIDANSVGPDLLIIHDNVNVTGFTITNTPAPPPEGSLPFSSYPTYDSGIEICNASQCFIYGNNLAGSFRGVCIENSSQICVTRNEFSDHYIGIDIESSTSNYVTNNIIRGKGVETSIGLSIKSSTANCVVNNTVTKTDAAMTLNLASDNIFRGNRLMSNVKSFSVKGNSVSDFINNVDTSNTINGKPIYYWIGKSNEIVPSDAGCIILVNCKGITVQEFSLPEAEHELVLVNTNNSIISGNGLTTLANVTLLGFEDYPYTYLWKEVLDILVFSSFDNEFVNNRANIHLSYSSRNTVTHNVGVVHLANSEFNTVSKNNLIPIGFLTSSQSIGVYLANSSRNFVEKNNITGLACGIRITGSSCNNKILENDVRDNRQSGITCEESPPSEGYNIISKNAVSGNGNWGIYIQSYFTQIIGNTVTQNGNWGIVLGDSVNCCIIGNVIEGLCFGGLGDINTQNCSIIGNNISATEVTDQRPIWFRSAYPGTLHHNNFLHSVTMDCEFSHIWDNGSEGNYWNCETPYQGIDANGDGISEVPFVIDENNQDNYPLMEPVNIELYQNYPV
jgi:parallel beta-helix repeat protein